MNTLASKPKGQCPVIAFYVPIIEIGEKRCIRISFFFVFYAKSGTTNNHWNRSSPARVPEVFVFLHFLQLFFSVFDLSFYLLVIIVIHFFHRK